MREKLLSIQLPDRYEENLFEYIPTLDGVPELIDYLNLGYSKNQYKKMTSLVAIESMKFNLIEAKKDNALSKEEVEKGNILIVEAIERYNSI